jgi:hypothetical protein
MYTRIVISAHNKSQIFMDRLRGKRGEHPLNLKPDKNIMDRKLLIVVHALVDKEK